MARSRRHKSYLLYIFLGISGLVVHPTVALMQALLRDPPRPLLRVVVSGEGTGIVHSSPEGISCGSECTLERETGSLIKLTATIGEGSTFQGWDGPCGGRSHVLFSWAGQVLFEAVEPEQFRKNKELAAFLGEVSEEPLSQFPLECEVTLERSVDVIARFGTPPEVLEMATVADPLAEQAKTNEELVVALPDSSWQPEELVELEDLEKLDEPEPEPEPVIPPKVTPAEAAPPPPPPQIAEVPKMKAVEVPDQNEVEEAPADARFLSDKNRDVAEESHATETNLDKQSDGEVAASSESTVESEDVGGEEAEIAQLEDIESTDLGADRNLDRSTGVESAAVSGQASGEGGEGGENGEGGNDRATDKPGLLSMRNINGRGALGSSGEPEEELETDPGEGGERGRKGREGKRGPKLRLEQDDYTRIVGQDVAEEEVAVARRKISERRGRWERKLGMVKSSLENFTPEVRPGNQTALKTRAAPFALFIARMHRRIHELWGFGFLEDLDNKASDHELNNWQLWTKLEIVINPDGTLDKLTIVKPSGVLPFDVAAMDTIYTSGPFEAPPAQIRSADGKVYMHWSFHRDWRQCGTFGAEPFILSSTSTRRDQGMSDGDMLKARRGGAPPVPQRAPSRGATGEASMSGLPAPDDPKAQHTANLWLSSFVTGNADKLAKVSTTPFRSGNIVAASSASEIVELYQRVLAESKNRHIKQWKVLTAAGYRQNVGSLPPGIEMTGAQLLLVVRYGNETLTLVLDKQKDQSYRVTGLHR